MMPAFELLQGDCLQQLATLPAASVQCCVTSPPYWGLRDYGVDGQLGLEETPDAYVANMVAVFREVRRVLRDDGTLWLNLGDSYARTAGDDSTKVTDGGMKTGRTGKSDQLFKSGNNRPPAGLKAKDLVGIPWRVAFALQADGWYLRQDIIWHKPNPMPESVTDRCTKAHEYIFLLTKSARYYYDNEAVKEPQICSDPRLIKSGIVRSREYGYSTKENELRTGNRKYDDVPINYAGNGTNVKGHKGNSMNTLDGKRNKRSVWTVTTKPYRDAHFATFPPKLIEPCILAGSAADTLVLDPFSGAGTTGVVAVQHGRRYIGIELNPDYLEMSRKRIQETRDGITLPMFT